MATQTHAPHHVRTDALAGALLIGAAVLVAGATVTLLGAQGAMTGDAPVVAEAVTQPMLLTPTSVERARITAVLPMLLTPTSVERARITAAPSQQAGADVGRTPERRGGR
jgi:hypothetical protein